MGDMESVTVSVMAGPMKPVTLQRLMEMPPYALADEEKDGILLAIIKEQLITAMNNPYISNFFNKQGIAIDRISRLEDVPPLPVQMFKFFDLATCPRDQVIKVLKSSGTTDSKQSRVPINKATAFNQTKALKSILSDYLGQKRRVFVVVDHEGMNRPNTEFTARTAGIRGLSIYSKRIIYLLKEVDGVLQVNEDAVRDLIDNYAGEEVYVFGFTYIMWTVLYKHMSERSDGFRFKDVKIFHSGGWKKLKEQAVSKEHFTENIARLFNTDPVNVLDFYGMAEQTGIIFVDCPCGNKHVPNFSQLIVRDLRSLKPCKVNEPGLIEVMSVLSDSYYCQALLTEDMGYLVGIDDCPCGRKGRYFQFQSRVEKAEVRGCGDTFREGRA
jgi:hypothetical protein